MGGIDAFSGLGNGEVVATCKRGNEFGFHKMWGVSSQAENLLTFKERFCSMV